ncbi:MAG TPA: DSD1 family PLP-dependent enzyme [Candidatus Dormibacteraeota bacterium]|nr:DSD1 family PLP-dependent enzyme [Candidatus Dormibacteraeota bacterium]
MAQSDLVRFADVDTPALLLDHSALCSNLELMAGYFKNRHAKLRPHFKSHKCTTIARMQIDAGAIGMTCAKLGEAEVLADAGITNILIANQIVGRVKIRRLVELSRRANPLVAVDSADNVKMLSEAAASAGVQFGVLIEIDVGMSRCGLPPGAAAVELARLIRSVPGLRLEGLQGYEGHCVDLRDETQRLGQTKKALDLLVGTRRQLEAAGIAVRIVSGGGTGTYAINGDYDGIDEVQAGSYACMDWWYTDIRPEFKQAMSILATVISRPKPGVIVIDVGRKGIGAEWGAPRVRNIPGSQVVSFTSEEHMKISVPEDSPLKVGDRLEIIPSHGCTTSNLYSEFVVYENGSLNARWPIEGRGKLQ